MKANYKGFVKHIESWDDFGVCYSLKDLIQLAEKYNTPIPVKIKLLKFPEKTIERLAYLWRKAENYYLDTDSDWQKERLRKIQNNLELNDEHLQILTEYCDSYGI